MLCDLLLHAQLCLRLLTHLPDPLLRGSVFLRDLALALIAELGHLLAGLGLLGLELLILFDLEVLHLPSHLHALLGQVLSLHVELRCFLGHLIGGFGQLFLHLFLLDRSLLLKVPLHDHHALLHSGLFGLHLALALLSEGFYLAAQFGLLFRHLVSLLIELASLLFQQLLVGLDFFATLLIETCCSLLHLRLFVGHLPFALVPEAGVLLLHALELLLHVQIALPPGLCKALLGFMLLLFDGGFRLRLYSAGHGGDLALLLLHLQLALHLEVRRRSLHFRAFPGHAVALGARLLHL
mmetsp:Transcript_161147/g.517250  ORF Transcript_161147/g.517250 Transcript_161147/m.517250 type:complete len:295 (+) Transcript_161147:3698-4582(+)